MTAVATPTAVAFRDDLVAAGVLIPTNAPGILGWSGEFEAVLNGLDAHLVVEATKNGLKPRWYPPLIARTDLETSGYLKSFPHLLGLVAAFHGGEREHVDMLQLAASGKDWTELFEQGDVVLSPAACYPLYPSLKGTLPPEGASVQMLGNVHRHEPSADPIRLRFFRVRELVRVGAPDDVLAFRAHWKSHAATILSGLGLEVVTDVANDPFFGRGGRMLAASQRELALKFEFLIPVSDAARPTAIGSVNYHEDHFGTAFGINQANGEPAHSSCLGFGLERVTLALFRQHGLRTADWPAHVRTTLGL
jgi:seryl-tRNA synthetase